MSCNVGHRHGSDPVLLWLWHRPAAAVQTGPLAQELPYAAGAAIKKERKEERKEGRKEGRKVDLKLHSLNSEARLPRLN